MQRSGIQLFTNKGPFQTQHGNFYSFYRSAGVMSSQCFWLDPDYSLSRRYTCLIHTMMYCVLHWHLFGNVVLSSPTTSPNYDFKLLDFFLIIFKNTCIALFILTLHTQQPISWEYPCVFIFIRRVLKLVIVIKTECSKPYVKMTTTKMLIFGFLRIEKGYTHLCKSCLGGGNEK